LKIKPTYILCKLVHNVKVSQRLHVFSIVLQSLMKHSARPYVPPYKTSRM